MARDNFNGVLRHHTHPMANPGYGKRVVPDQPTRHSRDFAHLPEREAYIAAYVDRLPDGAAMDVKTLAKTVPHYGQQAVRSALSKLSVVGHLRRVREMVGGDQTRWVYRTYFSRMARDDAWWAHFLTGDETRTPGPPARAEPVAAIAPPSPPERAPVRVVEPTTAASPTAGTVPSAPLERSAGRAVRPTAAAPTASAPSPYTRQPASPPVEPPTASDADEIPAAVRSAAYATLAELGRVDARLTLSVADCTVLAPLAAAWLARGITPSRLVVVLAAGLPEQVHSPAAFTRRRLVEKLPAEAPPAPASVAVTEPPPHRMMECTNCGLPGPPTTLTGGLCPTCRGESAPAPTGVLPIDEVKRYVQELRRTIRTHRPAPATGWT